MIRPAKPTLAEIAASIKAQEDRQAAARRAEDRKVFGPVLAMAAEMQAIMPRPTPQPLGTTAPTYITGTPARLAKANRAALAGMVERAKAYGRPEIIKAAIARVEASRAAVERGCALARHERGLNIFDYVEALAGLRGAL